MPHEETLFGAVDALLEQVAQDPLPPPTERKRLREAAGLSQDQVAKALQTRRESIGNWEAGRSEPRPPKRAAYARLLEGLAARFPTPVPDTFTDPTEEEIYKPPPIPTYEEALAQETAAREKPNPAAYVPPPIPPALKEPRTPAAAKAPASTTRLSSTSRRPGAKKAAPKETTAPAAAAVDPRFENGPLVVVDCEDGQVSAYCVGGLVLDVPAKSLPALVDWTLAEAKLGQPRLHRNGKDADPILVLTPAALERYGLPTVLSDEERRAGRLKDSHKVVKQIQRAELQLTQRGFGPWARVFREPQGSERRCVQLCIPSWNALDAREWDKKDDPQLPSMHPADLARYLGTYAQRVITPRGTTSTTGLELMTALRPPTRAEKDEATGEFKRAFNADALTGV